MSLTDPELIILTLKALVTGRVKIERLVGLLQEELKLETYEFELGTYGPWSRRLIKDPNSLIESRFVKASSCQ